MEILSIQKWIESGSGNCSGYGDGRGYCCSDGESDGSGFGSGAGRSESADIKFFCGSPVCYIDGIPTIITAVFGNYAKGYILGKFLTLNPCYIAKQESYFAHGETLSEAVFEVTVKHSITCRNMAEKS